jgi:chemotaxis protein histidine kinase CheA
VQLHGGELAIRSRLGVGTRVTVRLPFDCEKVRAVTPASNVEQLRLAEPNLPTDIKVRKRA